MVRVVLIDSGVDPRAPGVRGRGSLVDAGDGLRDGLGHGTFVAASILALCDEVELCSIRVFEQEVTCSIERLCAALEQARELRPALVNLSVGTTSIGAIEPLRTVIRPLLEDGVRVVSPAASSGMASYPGALEGVDAVVPDGNSVRTAPTQREHGGRMHWFASPHAASEAGRAPPSAHGASLATAHVTGLLARMLVDRDR